jgi:hypothetical protein
MAQHRPRPKKPPPFGLRVPRSPAWPPYQFIKAPGQPATRQRMTFWHFFNGIINYFTSLLPANEQDIRDVSQMLTTKIIALGNIVEEDLHAAYNSNLDYSHAILQFTEDVGRAAQAELARLSADIRALDTLERRHFHTLGSEIAGNKRELIVRISKAQAAAVATAVHISQRWVDKVWGHKIQASYKWVMNADKWWAKRIGTWWHVTYKKDIRPIYNNQKATNVNLSLIWATIEGQIDPTVKLVAKAGSWLKWFAHWKRDALIAFGTLKASEVAGWLEEKYVADRK